MEIGSFIELQFPKGTEFYNSNQNIIRLNSGRSAIWHALRILKCDTIWLPYYQCDSVRNFLTLKKANIKYYHVNDEFIPINFNPKSNEAVLLVNYYGIMSENRMCLLSQNYNNVIIDNSQAFFSKPIDNCMNIYSCRKFIGVPDGSYVIGKNAENIANYEQGYSSETSSFLLERIEFGCEGKAYKSRMLNEQRIASEDIKLMSTLTRTILDGTDYSCIIKKRQMNFNIASELFSDVNKIDPIYYYSKECVPMIYPLVIEDSNILHNLLVHKHFQGHWWDYLLDELPKDCFEYWLSKYIIPITIDQRYGRKEIEYIRALI